MKGMDDESSHNSPIGSMDTHTECFNLMEDNIEILNKSKDNKKKTCQDSPIGSMYNHTDRSLETNGNVQMEGPGFDPEGSNSEERKKLKERDDRELLLC